MTNFLSGFGLWYKREREREREREIVDMLDGVSRGTSKKLELIGIG